MIKHGSTTKRHTRQTLRHEKYKNAAHQLNGRRESVVTLSTRSLDFDLCLRMGRGPTLLGGKDKPLL
ncbi:hypothetical protein J6590_106030, partial [Homalodisca vitripennis]